METLRDTVLPPGFGFHPKDHELVSYYLKKKILGQKIEYDVIPEVDIYKNEPWDLPAKCNLRTQDNKWHFFASRDRKYPNGSRNNRATSAGYWKSTGKDRNIKMSNQNIGTKKTLVFHEGRPPSGRRTEWIMHEYYINEIECQACPDMKDAFVLCRVTKRDGWTTDNNIVVDNSEPHPQQPNDASTSVVSAEQPDAAVAAVISAEQPNHVDTPITSSELRNKVAIAATTADMETVDDNNLQAWLDELFDPFFDPAQDHVSADLPLAEESAESSNLQNLGVVAPKVELDYASPNQNVVDDTDYLWTDDFYNILYPDIDDFSHGVLQDPTDQTALAIANQANVIRMDAYAPPNNIVDGAHKEELQIPYESSEPNLSNEATDNGIIRRSRHGTTPASGMPPSSNRVVRLQVGVKKMVTANSESINQTIKFVDNSGRLDLMTNVEHQKKHAYDVTSSKRSDAGKSSKDHSNQGFLRGVRKALSRGCSAAGVNVLVAVCMIGAAAAAAAVILHRGRHDGVTL